MRRNPRSEPVYRGQSGGRGIRTHGDVAVTMVFKIMCNFLTGGLATLAFSVGAHHAKQDHPVHIPRDLNRAIRHLAATSGPVLLNLGYPAASAVSRPLPYPGPVLPGGCLAQCAGDAGLLP